MTRQRQNLFIALAVFAFVALAALEISSEVRAGRRSDHPGQLHGDAGRFRIEVVDDAGVTAPTPAQRRGVEGGLAAMQSWLGAHGGAVVTRNTDVYLTAHGHCPGASRHAGASGITVGGKRICVFTADTPSLLVPFLAGRTAAHEAIHVLQFELGCGPPVPSWLIEGMAEDLSWRAMAPNLDQAVLLQRAAVSERNGGGGLNYGRAMGAALELDGGHPARLVAFCRAVGDGTPWPLAFSQAFDASPAKYAGRF